MYKLQTADMNKIQGSKSFLILKHKLSCFSSLLLWLPCIVHHYIFLLALLERKLVDVDIDCFKLQKMPNSVTKFN